MNRRSVLSTLVLWSGWSLLGRAQRVAPPPPSGPELFAVVTDGSTTGLYHTRDCAWVVNHSRLLFTQEDMEKRYFRPHCLCVTGKEGMPPCSSR
jgi:hypothetical protein